MVIHERPDYEHLLGELVDVGRDSSLPELPAGRAAWNGLSIRLRLPPPVV